MVQCCCCVLFLLRGLHFFALFSLHISHRDDSGVLSKVHLPHLQGLFAFFDPLFDILANRPIPLLLDFLCRCPFVILCDDLMSDFLRCCGRPLLLCFFTFLDRFLETKESPIEGRLAALVLLSILLPLLPLSDSTSITSGSLKL